MAKQIFQDPKNSNTLRTEIDLWNDFRQNLSLIYFYVHNNYIVWCSSVKPILNIPRASHGNRINRPLAAGKRYRFGLRGGGFKTVDPVFNL